MESTAKNISYNEVLKELSNELQTILPSVEKIEESLCRLK